MAEESWPVKVYIYDLSKGMARSLSQALIGKISFCLLNLQSIIVDGTCTIPNFHVLCKITVSWFKYLFENSNS